MQTAATSSPAAHAAKHLSAILWCMMAIGAASRASGQTLRISVPVPPDNRNAAPALRQAIAQAIAATNAGKAKHAQVVLDAGDYPLDAVAGDDYAILSINGAQNVTLGGVGPATRLLVRDHAFNHDGLLRKVLAVSNTQGFVLHDLSIDFAPAARDWLAGIAHNVVLTPSGVVEMDLKLDEHSPPFRSNTFAVAGSSCIGIAINQHDAPRKGFPDYFVINHVTTADTGVKLTTGRWSQGNPQPFLEGQRVLVIRRKPAEALISFNGRNIHPVLRNIRVRASRGMMIEAYGCDRLELDHLIMQPAEGQWLISPGDGIHYQGGIEGPYVHDCHFEMLGDDAMNLYAKPFTVSVKPSAGLIQCDDARRHARIGDQLWLHNHSAPGKGQLLRVGCVMKDAIQADSLRAGLTPDRAVNLSASGSGFIIRNNTFGPMRGIGCRIQTGDGIIEDNTFTSLSGPAVSFESGLGQAYDEGPFPYDVVVKSNHFLHCGLGAGYNGQAVRYIAPWNFREAPNELPFSNLRLTGNSTDSGG